MILQGLSQSQALEVAQQDAVSVEVQKAVVAATRATLCGWEENSILEACIQHRATLGTVEIASKNQGPARGDPREMAHNADELTHGRGFDGRERSCRGEIVEVRRDNSGRRIRMSVSVDGGERHGQAGRHLGRAAHERVLEVLERLRLRQGLHVHVTTIPGGMDHELEMVFPSKQEAVESLHDGHARILRMEGIIGIVEQPDCMHDCLGSTHLSR
eukprot:scaffold5218_cov150-Ochromonas_danica.AAC.11